MAASGSRVLRYGVTECSRAGVYSRTSGTCWRCSGSSPPSSATIRRRNWLTNDWRGEIGAIGSRSRSNGSVVIAPPFDVGDAERVASAYEQCLGGMDRAVEVVGDLPNRQPVEVAQRQRAPVVRPQLIEHGARLRSLEPQVHVVLVHIGFLFCHEAQPARFARLLAPVVDELVPRDGDEPR